MENSSSSRISLLGPNRGFFSVSEVFSEVSSPWPQPCLWDTSPVPHRREAEIRQHGVSPLRPRPCPNLITSQARRKHRREKAYLKPADEYHLPNLSLGWPSQSGPHQSVQFSCSVVSYSLQPHGLQHARLPCPSPTPGVYSNSCSSSQWCHPTFSSSVVPVSSHLQSFSASGSFPMTQFFTSGSRSTGVTASVSVLPMDIQDWFPLVWTGWISLQSKGLSRVFSNTTVQKRQFFSTQLSLYSNSHMTTGKTIALTRQTFVGKVTSAF